MNEIALNGFLHGKPVHAKNKSGAYEVNFYIDAYSQYTKRQETIPCKITTDVARFQTLVSPCCYLEITGALVVTPKSSFVLVEKVWIKSPEAKYPVYIRKNELLEELNPKKVIERAEKEQGMYLSEL